MKVTRAHVSGVWIHYPEGFTDLAKWLESIARTCYKSEDKITEDSASKFVQMLKNRGHHAMLEHAVITARIVGDRGLTHEQVRHRLASYAQESTRYCNYSKGKFSEEIVVVEQPDLIEMNNPLVMAEWMRAMENAERHYMRLLELGAPTGGARSVLPIGLKSEIVVTANLREWMHAFEFRVSKYAHKIISSVMMEIERQMHQKVPDVFEDRRIGLIEVAAGEGIAADINSGPTVTNLAEMIKYPQLMDADWRKKYKPFKQTRLLDSHLQDVEKGMRHFVLIRYPLFECVKRGAKIPVYKVVLDDFSVTLLPTGEWMPSEIETRGCINLFTE